jgi:hypothetical protein
MERPIVCMVLFWECSFKIDEVATGTSLSTVWPPIRKHIRDLDETLVIWSVVGTTIFLIIKYQIGSTIYKMFFYGQYIRCLCGACHLNIDMLL